MIYLDAAYIAKFYVDAPPAQAADAETQNVLRTALELRSGWLVFFYPGSG